MSGLKFKLFDHKNNAEIIWDDIKKFNIIGRFLENERYSVLTSTRLNDINGVEIYENNNVLANGMQGVIQLIAGSYWVVFVAEPVKSHISDFFKYDAVSEIYEPLNIEVINQNA